jgi:hypothetical protein
MTHFCLEESGNARQVPYLAKALYGEYPENDRGKGTNGAPKRTRRLMCANAGSPTSREAQGDGTPIVRKCIEALTEGAASDGRQELVRDTDKQGRY